MEYFQHDNFQAFGIEPITIELEDKKDEEETTKALVVFNDGILVKEYSLEKNNLVFPLKVEITEEDSEILPLNVFVKLIVFDKQNREKTCEGTLEFQVKGRTIKNASNI